MNRSLGDVSKQADDAKPWLCPQAFASCGSGQTATFSPDGSTATCGNGVAAGGTTGATAWARSTT